MQADDQRTTISTGGSGNDLVGDRKMKETGILFTPDNYAKCLGGTKTQTRRLNGLDIVNDTPEFFSDPLAYAGSNDWQFDDGPDSRIFVKCPYGTIGDRLYVKEACLARANGKAYLYKRDYSPVEAAGIGGMYGGWKSPLFVPKRSARLWLEITDVQVQRLITIPQLDAMEEGADGPDYKVGYKAIWESINGPGSWEANPYVWAISFKKVSP